MLGLLKGLTEGTRVRDQLRVPSSPWKSTAFLTLVCAVMAGTLAADCRGRDAGDVPRSLDARLGGQVAFRRCRPLGPPVGELSPSRCGSAAPTEGRRLRAVARRSSIHRLAAALAASASTEALARELERLGRSPGRRSADWETAMGALEHAFAQASGELAHLIAAFEHTEAALAAAPSSPVALFNRALIATDLGMCRLAASAWRRYLRLDPASEWADEAAQRLALLPCRHEHGSASGFSADEILNSALEDLLPRWVAARANGAAAARQVVTEMAQAGERLESRTGEPLVRELAQELRMASDPEHLAALAAYVQGRTHFEAEDYEPARRELRRAAAGLGAHGSCLAPWAELWLSGIDLFSGRFAAADARLEAVAQSAAFARSRHLRGRIDWARGLSAGLNGRLQTGYDFVTLAEEELRRGDAWLSAASVQTLGAEIRTHLGFVREAWSPRILALRTLQAAPDRYRFLLNGLLVAATSAQQSGAHAAADAFLAEASAVAQARHDGIYAAEASLTRARALRARGAHARASEEYRTALAAIRSIDDDLVRERFERTAWLGLWADPGRRDGREEVEAFRSTVSFFAENGPPSLRLEALRVQAGKERRNGQTAAARRTIDAAIAVVRGLQRDITSEMTGIRQLDHVQSVFDDAIDGAVDDGLPLRALGLLEAARRGAAAPPSGEAALSGLTLAIDRTPDPRDPQPLVVVFGMTPRHVVWWRLDGERIRWGWHDRARLQPLIEAIVDSAPAGHLPAAAQTGLYAALLGDALDGVALGRPLILVPDGLLQRVPFVALRNPETGVRLIEERAVSLRTSLRAAREPSSTGGGAPPRRDWDVLAVGDPAFDRKRLRLDRLPGAAREAEQVAGSYGRATLLLGEHATATAVRREAAAAEALHLATHAVPGAEDPFAGALVLAAGEDTTSSGLATIAEILPSAASGLQLVVLSGCSTLGLAPSRSGGLLGLAQAIAARGVPATLGTLWPVDDRRMPELMAEFHAALLDGHSAAEALRRAQLAYLARPEHECCDWAALQLFGDLPAEPAP